MRSIKKRRLTIKGSNLRILQKNTDVNMEISVLTAMMHHLHFGPFNACGNIYLSVERNMIDEKILNELTFLSFVSHYGTIISIYLVSIWD